MFFVVALYLAPRYKEIIAGLGWKYVWIENVPRVHVSS